VLYDLAIIGGGPAGVAAGVYAARKKLRTIFITKDFGGQSTVSTGIENWIGTISISGFDLAKNLKAHLAAYAGKIIDIEEGAEVKNISHDNDGIFNIETSSGTRKAKMILIATGSSRKKLDAKNADKFEHKGITYCASCDGPLFAGKEVAVVGGGNAAFETIIQLLAYCKKVILIHRRDIFRADPVTVEKVISNPKVQVLKNTKIIEAVGNKMLEKIIIQTDEKKPKEIKIGGVFVEIGSIPATGFAKDIVKLNEFGQIITNPKNQQTSTDGIWSAGDCSDGLYHQNNIAAGDAVKALEDIYLFLNAR
jgi:thioredoxin reductase